MKPITTLAYVAGLFDGEGCVGIYTTTCGGKQALTHYLRVELSNTHEPVMDWLHGEFGGSLQRYDRHGTRRTCWSWNLAGKKGADFLVQILPYLRIKHKQVALAIQFQQQKSRDGVHLSPEELTKRENYRIQLSNLKREEF